MPIIRDLLARFRFDVEHEKLDKIERQLDGIKDRLGLIAGIEIGRALFELAEKFSNLGVEIKTAAMSAGLTVEAFQSLAFSAKNAAVDQQQMENSLFRISKKLYDARNGSAEAQLAFSQVGFTPDQVNTFKNSQEVLLALADRFKNIKDPIQRAAVSSELLGRGSMHMVAWLSKGSAAMREEAEEAKRLGFVLRGDQIESMTKLEHALTKVGALFKAVSGAIAADISPAIVFLTNKFLELFAVNQEMIHQNIEGWLLFLVDKFSFFAGVIYGLTVRFINLAKAFHIEGSLGATTAELVTWIGSAWAAVKVITILTAAWSAWNVAVALTALKIAAIVYALHEIMALWKGQATWTGSGVNTLLNADWGKVASLGAPEPAVSSMASSTVFGPSTQNNSLNSSYNATFVGGNAQDQMLSYEQFISERNARDRREFDRSRPVTPLR